MRAGVVAAVLVAIFPWSFALRTDASAQSPPAPRPSASASDLDALMARVLDRRNETWRALQDYILSERERFELTGPGDVRLYGTRREFTWFVRDGYLIRSPVRFDGVAPDARTRQEYEERWLREEQSRETNQADKSRKAGDTPKKDGASADSHAASAGEPAPPYDSAALVRQGLEPRFISEAYFLGFKFDPGNYYLAGRETLDGRAVLRIEYYPTRLFTDDENSDGKRDDEKKKDQRTTEAAGGTKGKDKGGARADRHGQRGGEPDEDRFEQDIERKMNKVALVTLWVDPAEQQIVKYTFDNTDLNFLPGRWLLRVGDISASMTMGQYFQGVWLPRDISVHASLTLANGTYDAGYGREFFDYRQGEVKARIRSYTPREN